MMTAAIRLGAKYTPQTNDILEGSPLVLENFSIAEKSENILKHTESFFVHQ